MSSPFVAIVDDDGSARRALTRRPQSAGSAFSSTPRRRRFSKPGSQAIQRAL